MGEWIKCSDRMPKNNDYVLAGCLYSFMDDSFLRHSGYTIITLMYFDNEDGKCWFDDRTGDEQEYKSVTHWQPLPEPPKTL